MKGGNIGHKWGRFCQSQMAMARLANSAGSKRSLEKSNSSSGWPLRLALPLDSSVVVGPPPSLPSSAVSLLPGGLCGSALGANSSSKSGSRSVPSTPPLQQPPLEETIIQVFPNFRPPSPNWPWQTAQKPGPTFGEGVSNVWLSPVPWWCPPYKYASNLAVVLPTPPFLLRLPSSSAWPTRLSLRAADDETDIGREVSSAENHGFSRRSE